MASLTQLRPSAAHLRLVNSGRWFIGHRLSPKGAKYGNGTDMNRLAFLALAWRDLPGGLAFAW